MTKRIHTLITAGVIAVETGEPIHRVLRVLSTRSHIRPYARAGTLRLYEEKDIQAVREAIDEIDSRRKVHAAAGEVLQ